MLIEGLIFALASILVAVVAIVLATAIRTSIAKEKFKKKSRGMPIVDQFRYIGGHINTLVFKPNLNNYLNQYHDKVGKSYGYFYGPVPMVMTIDLDLIKKIAIDDQLVNTNRTKLHIPVKEVEIDSIMLAKDDQWRRIRRAIGPALKSNRFTTPNVTREIDSSIGKLINAIDRRLDEAGPRGEMDINFDDLFHRYSLDLVLSCFFKQNNVIDFHSKKDDMVEVVDAGLDAFRSSWLFRASLIFPPIRSLVDWLIMNFHPQGKWRADILQFIKAQTRLNLEAKKQLKQLQSEGKQVDEDNFTLKDGTQFSRNMIDYVVDRYHEGKLNNSEYFHSSFFLLNAADKTSADALCHTLYRLATNQDIQDKLRKSILEEGTNSEYLTWVLNESLRLLPPVTIGCSRTIKHDLETSEGYVIPAGTFVITPNYAIHRLKEYWGPDVETFRPERFAEQRNFHPMQYIPFGAGIRMCPGREFALHEMKRLFCELLTRYKFECEPKDMAFDAPLFIFTISKVQLVVRVSRYRQAGLHESESRNPSV